MGIELQTTLALILQQLADFFGMSVDTISANAPMWLAKYGQYCVWGDIIENLALGFFIAVLALLGFFAIFYMLMELDTPVPGVLSVIVVLIIYLIGAIAIPLIRCNAAPEIYGLMNLIELIKS